MASPITFTNLASSGISPQSMGLQNKINPAPLQKPVPTWQQTLANNTKPSNPSPTGGYSNYASNYLYGDGGMTKNPSGSNYQPKPQSPTPSRGMGGTNTPANTSTGKINNASNAGVGETPSQYVNPTPDLPTPPAPAAPIFNQAVNSLNNQQNSSYNNFAMGAINNLSNVTKNNEQYAINAKDIANAAGQKISDIGGQGARGEAGYLTTGTSPVGEGNAAVLAQSTAAQQQAVAQGANMQLSGNAQALNAQNQLQSGYNEVAGQSLTGQSTAQGALGTAGQLTQPHFNGYVGIDPTTGQPIGGGGGISNAIARGGNYDAQAQGAKDYGVAQQSITGAQNQIDSITQLVNSAGLNKLGINAANATVQALQNNLSSSDYATLKNALGAINATLTQVTGSPVDVAQLSTQQGTSLITTINNQLALAKAKAQGYLNSGQGGQANNTSQSGGKGIWSF